MAESKILTNKILLWENTTSTSSFAEQNLSIDCSPYKEIEIWYRPNGTGAVLTYKVCRFTVVAPTQTGYIFDVAGPAVYRSFTIYSDRLYFGPGYYYANYGGLNATVASGNIIPIKIYGVK